MAVLFHLRFLAEHVSKIRNQQMQQNNYSKQLEHNEEQLRIENIGIHESYDLLSAACPMDCHILLLRIGVVT